MGKQSKRRSARWSGPSRTEWNAHAGLDASRKDDHGKRRWHLLPWAEVGQVVDVLTYGAQKYAPHNWQKIEDGPERYFDALQRHITAWFSGEQRDPESGLHHLAHAACNALFLLWFDCQGRRL